MRSRQTRPYAWPRRWLMTDERMGMALWPALRRMPRGSGVVFRHLSTAGKDRERIGRAVARICHRRGLLLAVAGDIALARRLGATIVHNPAGPKGLMPHSQAVHDEGEARRARRERANLVMVSPLFETRSHPDAKPLGIAGARSLARMSGAPALALGGVSEKDYRRLRSAGFSGYAGIDCWIRI